MITETVIDIRYPECDSMGIVHHSVYAVWYEIARMDFFEKVGFGYSAMHEKGIDPPMVDLHVMFRSSVSYPGSVTIRTKATLASGKKLRLHYECYSGETLVNVCDTFHIWTGPDHKSLDMENALPEVFALFADALEEE